MTWLDCLWPYRVSGLLMLTVGLGAAVFAARSFRIQWRWLWCGVLVFDVAVALKYGIAAVTNEPLLAWLKHTLPRSQYLLAGSIYGGLLSGVTEVAVTLLAGRLWPRLAQSPQRAAGVGLGAGCNEAVLLGLISTAVVAAPSLPTAGSLAVLLIPPLERLLLIFVHTAVRMLALYAVATRSMRWFWAAFLFFSAIDALATFYHLNGLINSPDGQTYSVWIELTFLPFAIAAIAIAEGLGRRWPSTAGPGK